MTYIEFFDKTDIENVATCLVHVPDKVLFLSDNTKRVKKRMACYREVFAARGQNIEFEAKAVSKSKLDEAVRALTQIVNDYDDCVFDITGGEELLLLALGIVLAQNPDKNIQVHKVSVQNNKVYDYDRDSTTAQPAEPTLTVAENVRIYGGRVVLDNPGAPQTNRWDMNEEFRQDLVYMWDLCKRDIRLWNAQIGTFTAIEAVGQASEDGRTTVASQAAIKKYLGNRGYIYIKAADLVAPLMELGLITALDDSGEETVTISYKNAQVKKCLTRGGLLLEMKVFMTMLDVQDDEGKPIYQDALNGVVIDWDGEFHDSSVEDERDTQNEVDIMAMHDILPVFISCKTGVFTAEELYKLNTVAQRFGGDYAKKVLVSMALDSLGDAGKYLRQRAEDMGIQIIENIQNMDEEALLHKFRTLWNN